MAHVVVILVTWLLFIIMLALEPWLTHENVLFGVAYSDLNLVRKTDARKLRRRYLIWFLSGAFVLSLIMIFLLIALEPLTDVLPIIWGLSYTILTIYSLTLIASFHQKSIQLINKLDSNNTKMGTTKLTVDLNVLTNDSVASPWLSLIVFPLPIAALVFLNKINQQNFRMLFSLFGLAFVIMFTFLLTRRAPGTIRGNPKIQRNAILFRNRLVYFLLGIGVFVEGTILFQLTNSDLFQRWNWVFFIIDILLIMGLIAFYIQYKRIQSIQGSLFNDNQYWFLGFFYCNKQDPSVFVEKRIGIGFTLNLARPMSWLFLGSLVLIIAVLVSLNFNI